MSLLCVKILDFKLFSTFLGMQKKIAKHVTDVRKLKNTKYCMQNNVQSCFVERPFGHWSRSQQSPQWRS